MKSVNLDIERFSGRTWLDCPICNNSRFNELELLENGDIVGSCEHCHERLILNP